MSCSHSQELGQRYDLAPDWLHESKEPIRSQVSKLTKLLTMTKTHKFPFQVNDIHYKKTDEADLDWDNLDEDAILGSRTGMYIFEL